MIIHTTGVGSMILNHAFCKSNSIEKHDETIKSVSGKSIFAEKRCQSHILR